MYQIKLLNKISKSGLQTFDSSKFSYGEDVASPDGILVRSADMLNAAFGKNLLCIGRAGAGVNNIPVDRCSEEGIVVFNTPGANANAVKEMAVCALLLASRKVVDAVNWVSSVADQGDEIPKLVEKNKSKFAGPELKGKTLGVIGLGAVGAQLANTAVSLGMDVYGYDPFLTVDAAWRLSRSVRHAKSEKELYEKCDYISVHIPYNKDTKGQFNASVFAEMKDGVRIINLARGELFNNADLVAALESGKIACYVTDFPNSDVIKAPNTVCIPHLAASTPESEENCAVMAVKEISDYIDRGIIKNSVNFPDMDPVVGEGSALLVLHRNIPNMIANVTQAFSSLGINIESLTNKSKKDYAATVAQIVDGEIPESVCERLSGIEGIIRVRVLK
ncbi:MAG: phosphoglycerate dehydrogenase [Clostridia bacterium]|nr:phosphoglycerate dehydrogenase [Clostridia bacterium]MBR5743482.1 phosphoglycerate dehydrogenase [Clostridia bacterium]